MQPQCWCSPRTCTSKRSSSQYFNQGPARVSASLGWGHTTRESHDSPRRASHLGHSREYRKFASRTPASSFEVLFPGKKLFRCPWGYFHVVLRMSLTSGHIVQSSLVRLDLYIQPRTSSLVQSPSLVRHDCLTRALYMVHPSTREMHLQLCLQQPDQHPYTVTSTLKNVWILCLQGMAPIKRARMAALYHPAGVFCNNAANKVRGCW